MLIAIFQSVGRATRGVHLQVVELLNRSGLSVVQQLYFQAISKDKFQKISEN